MYRGCPLFGGFVIRGFTVCTLYTLLLPWQSLKFCVSFSTRDNSGIKDVEQQGKARKKMKLAQRWLSRQGRQGESDRAIYVKKPKYLFAGKRKSGKTQRR